MVAQRLEQQKGSSYLNEFLNTARVEAGAAGVGIAQGAFDRALDYAKKREQFGKAIVTFDPNLIALYKALGGGWENASMPGPKAPSYIDLLKRMSDKKVNPD